MSISTVNFINIAEIKAISAAMAAAYRATKNRQAACNKVQEQYPETSFAYMFGLWEAIDAYEDQQS